MRDAGLATRRDAAGNLFGRLAARAEGPTLLTGSHLDSVPHGGNYDGPAGVLCAIEALQTLRENGVVPARPIEAVSFQGEEGSRFPAGLLGSSIVAGAFRESPQELRDRDGVTLADALRGAGLDPARLADARAEPGRYAAYVELHIEQARLLESKGLACGVVTAIAGMLQFHGSIHGRADHAGACPMDLRRDSLAAAAELVLEVERAARESHPDTRATVGLVHPHPGAANVVAGRTDFTLDIRDQDEGRRDACAARVRAALEGIAARRGLTAELAETHAAPPVPCATEIVAAIEAAAAEAGIAVTRLPSGAVHDASNLARLCPVGMIFVRSRDGVSHSPAEYSSPEDLAAGAQLLMGALRNLAGR
jgi:allantoate deiminase